MKKLYRKGTVHPSPPIISDQYLSSLPATILTLAAALSPEDREVLAYLISCNSTSSNDNHRNKFSSSGQKRSYSLNDHDHGPCFTCDCFRCYMSYWIRWDTSPKRQLIHEIIDAYEEGLVLKGKGKINSKRERKRSSKRNNNNNNNKSSDVSSHELNMTQDNGKLIETDQTAEENSGRGGSSGGGEDQEKGSVRRFFSFMGERIWGASI